MKKIAFCFLIYDIINHEELWNLFFQNVDTNKYNIYIHYKSNKPLKYFEKYKLNNCIETEYATYTLSLAYNILFREAYQDIDNYKFIILSGACVPFKNFNFIYNKLTMDNFGYFNICPQSQCFPMCNCLINKIKTQLISKSHSWFILNRILVEQLCFDKDDILKTYYFNIHASEEYFYYTFIKILNLENNIITTLNSSNDGTTFTNWKGTDYKYPCNNGLKNYAYITEDELYYLMNSKCLFGRKFNKECTSLYNSKYIDFIQST